MKVDFPLPDTPVTQVNVPMGIFAETFFKLFPVAPLKCKYFPLTADLRFFGTLINFLPER